MLTYLKNAWEAIRSYSKWKKLCKTINRLDEIRYHQESQGLRELVMARIEAKTRERNDLQKVLNKFFFTKWLTT